MDYDKMQEELVNWIRETVEEANGKGVVVGLSGGIDSSVVGVLCKNAFPDNTLGLILPCHSNDNDELYAKMVAEKFRINTRKIDLSNTFDTLRDTLEALDAPDNNLAIANLKPRLRMTTLYYFANKLHYLVVGTDDRSESVMGYFTKFGDGAADLLPIANLLKSEVQELGAYMGIPKVIVTKPPTPGLWKGQTGEGELGITYKEIDSFLSGSEVSQNIKEHIIWRYHTTEHKRKLPLTPKERVNA